MNPNDKTATSLARLGIFGMYRKGKGWNLYKCGIAQATKLTFSFTPAEFATIQASYIGFMKNKQLKEKYNL
jgi:hypothetical protein